MKATGSSPIVATKFAPLPWRLTGASVPVACKESLGRLQLQQMGLYIQHWCVGGDMLFYQFLDSHALCATVLGKVWGRVWYVGR